MKRTLSQEAYLAEEFRLLEASPHVTHLKQSEDCYYRVVTVAAPRYVPYQNHANTLAILFASASNLGIKGSNLDRFLVDGFASLGYGVAPCHQSDNFSRKLGRIMSKGRLLKILRALGARRCI